MNVPKNKNNPAVLKQGVYALSLSELQSSTVFHRASAVWAVASASSPFLLSVEKRIFGSLPHVSRYRVVCTRVLKKKSVNITPQLCYILNAS